MAIKSKEVLDEQTVISTLQNYRQEAETAKRSRMQKNKQNFDTFHLKQDWSHKNKGQSKEFLPKQSMAVEQAANFIQQGLVDLGEWFKVEEEEGVDKNTLKIKPEEIQILLRHQLDKMNFVNKVGDATKLGLLGSLMIAKVTGKIVTKPTFRIEEELKATSFVRKLIKRDDKIWQLQIDLVRQEDYFPDPTGRGLYEFQDIETDFFEIERLSKGPNAIYDKAAVDKLRGSFTQNHDQRHNKSRETGQNTTFSTFRRPVKLTELWGNILDSRGNLIYENIVTTIANDQFVLRKPTPNPLWHGESPFVVAPIISVPHSVWHRALMDAPTMLNKAINEIFNLTLDGGLMAVHGIKQIREHWLEDPSQIEEGVAPAETLRANTSCPPGQKVLERIDTASVPPEVLSVLNIINQEFNTSALTNDLRQGVQSFRAVKATEVVEASQSITSMFTGMAKSIEEKFISKILAKSWKTMAQHMTELNPAVTKSLLGTERGRAVIELSNEEIFSETVNATVFRVFGISLTLNRQRDFTKLQGLLQTIGGSETLTEAFVQKFSFPKLLEEIMKSLDINIHKLEEEVPEGSAQPQEPAPQGAPDQQSQIPQAGAPTQQGDLTPEGAIPQTEFPPSRATGALS